MEIEDKNLIERTKRKSTYYEDSKNSDSNNSFSSEQKENDEDKSEISINYESGEEELREFDEDEVMPIPIKKEFNWIQYDDKSFK